MKKFKITSNHIVYVDSYEEGELDYKNGYTVTQKVFGKNYKEAVNKYLNDHLGFNLTTKNCEVNYENNTLETSILVDEENYQATNDKIELWKTNDMVLYSNIISISIEKLIPLKLS